MLEATGLWGLFLSALISSTLFPGGSEVILAILSYKNVYPQWQLLTVATLGNTLGAMSTWGIGRLIALRYDSGYVFDPRKQAAIERVKKWGAPLLLLSWLPILGDPLCLAAGWVRLNVLVCLLFIACGKVLRYYVIFYLAT